MGAIHGEADERGTKRKPSAGVSEEDRWLEMRSVALYDLGMSADEFFDSTPRQLDALIRRDERSKQDNEFLFGQLASVYVNFSMARPKKAVSPSDFMPSEWIKHPVATFKRRRKRQLIATEIRGVMENWLKRGG